MLLKKKSKALSINWLFDYFHAISLLGKFKSAINSASNTLASTKYFILYALRNESLSGLQFFFIIRFLTLLKKLEATHSKSEIFSPKSNNLYEIKNLF